MPLKSFLNLCFTQVFHFLILSFLTLSYCHDLPYKLADKDLNFPAIDKKSLSLFFFQSQIE